jgi:hypothetical protein
MMKKIVAGLMVALGCMSAQAGVLCVVNPTSPVYHVDTYVRMQSSCKTTAYAGGAGGSAVKALGTTAGFLAVVVAGIKVAQFIENNKEENKYLVYEITWADGNTDLIKVRSEEGDFKEATQKIRAKFANASTPIKSLSWVSLGQPKVDMIIE